MLSLPNAELYVWIRWNEEGEKLAEEIEKLLGFEPYEATISQGTCDLRWEAKDFQAAVGFAEQLKQYAEREEIVLLKATGRVADEPGSCEFCGVDGSISLAEGVLAK